MHYLKIILQKFFSDELFKKIFVLSGGMGLAQLIIIAFSPILTRIYSPEDFGILSIFVSFLGITIVVSSMRFERVIPIVKSSRSYVVVLWISLIALILTTLLITIILILFGSEIISVFNMNEFEDYIWILPIGIFFTGLYEIYSYVATRYQKFFLLGRTRVFQAVGQTSSQLFLSLLNLGAIGLIFGSILGRSLGVYSLIKLSLNDWNHRPKGKYFLYIYAHLKRFRLFPVIQVPSAILNRLATMSPQFLFFTLYDARVAGLIFLAQQIVAGPLIFISRSISKAFFGHVSNLNRNSSESLLKIIDITVIRLLIIGIIPISFLAWLGPSIFGLIFGDQWVESGTFARYLSIYLLAQFSIAPIFQTLIVVEKLITLAVIDVFRLLVVIAAILIIHEKNYGIDYVVIGYSLSLSIAYVFGYILVRKSIKINDSMYKNET